MTTAVECIGLCRAISTFNRVKLKTVTIQAMNCSTQKLFMGEKHAALYAKFRPTYPEEVFEKIVSYCREGSGEFELAVDVGCGSGQSTLPLTKYYKKVFGVDVSEQQLKNAPSDIPNLTFQVSSAEELGFIEDDSTDLVTVAQAFHWVDQNKFYEEVTRILRSKGCLVVYGYGLNHLEHPQANAYFKHLHNDILGSYWAEGRRMVVAKYRSFGLPFPGWKRDDSLSTQVECSVDDFVGYLSSWSAIQTYEKEHPSSHLMKQITSKFKSLYAAEEQGAELKVNVSWPVFILMGRKP